MKTKNKKTSNFKKASTPEMIEKQRAAIISYYAKKRSEEPSKNLKTKKSKKTK
jgi:hypothetical protein